jgi:hypothetical protein
MKKLLTLLFALVIAFSLTMPVFAQETGGGEAPAPKSEKKKMKKHKAAKKKGTKKKKGQKTEGETQ